MMKPVATVLNWLM